MGIKVQHTPAAAVMQLGELAGASRAAVQQQARDAAKEQAVRSLQHQREMAEFNAQIQLDRDKFRLMADFQGEQRAAAWHIEKAELRSRADFEQEERKRRQVLDEYNATIKYINDSDWIDDAQKPGFEFKAKMKLLNQGVTDRTIFPVLYARQGAERPPSPTQRISAMKMLETEQFQEPNWLQKLLPGGKGELSQQDILQRQILEGIVAGKPNVPGGTISPAVPKTDYVIGETLIRNGQQYKVVGFCCAV